MTKDGAVGSLACSWILTFADQYPAPSDHRRARIGSNRAGSDDDDDVAVPTDPAQLPTHLTINCTSLRDGESQVVPCQPSTTAAEILVKVLAKYGLQHQANSFCLAFVKGQKKNRSFRGTTTKPHVIQPGDCPIFNGYSDSIGRFAREPIIQPVQTPITRCAESMCIRLAMCPRR